jgi:hypothetical protein
MTSGKENKTPARRPAFRIASLSTVLVVVVMIIEVLVMVAVPMLAMFAPDVMAVSPCPVVVGPMACDPDHFVVPTIVARAVAVIRPVANLNAKALRSRGGRK